jgi:acetylornithine aminotransferase
VRKVSSHASELMMIMSTLQPCDSYLSVTHPDGSADENSEVAHTLKRFDAATLATYARPTVLLSRGKGLDLFAKVDASNEPGGSPERHYLDFSSGIAVNSLGHADEQIAQIAYEQANTLVHSSNLYHNEWSGELADRMVELTREHGGLGMEKGAGQRDNLKVFLANSGTEANEGKGQAVRSEIP